jgi:hypothetical protein
LPPTHTTRDRETTSDEEELEKRFNQITLSSKSNPKVSRGRGRGERERETTKSKTGKGRASEDWKIRKEFLSKNVEKLRGSVPTLFDMCCTQVYRDRREGKGKGGGGGGEVQLPARVAKKIQGVDQFCNYCKKGFCGPPAFWMICRTRFFFHHLRLSSQFCTGACFSAYLDTIPLH